MKIFLIFLNIFFLNQNLHANNFDYTKYYLTYTEKIINKCYECSSYTKITHIYNNKIFSSIGKIEDGNLVKVDDGIYNYKTDNNSQIKIIVKDSQIIDMKVLSKIEDFKNREKMLDDDCLISLFYFVSNEFRTYNKEEIKSYSLKDYNDIFNTNERKILFKTLNNIKFSIIYNERMRTFETLKTPHYFTFSEASNSYFTSIISKDVDLKIENCIVRN